MNYIYELYRLYELYNCTNHRMKRKTQFEKNIWTLQSRAAKVVFLSKEELLKIYSLHLRWLQQGLPNRKLTSLNKTSPIFRRYGSFRQDRPFSFDAGQPQ